MRKEKRKLKKKPETCQCNKKLLNGSLLQLSTIAVALFAKSHRLRCLRLRTSNIMLMLLSMVNNSRAILNPSAIMISRFHKSNQALDSLKVVQIYSWKDKACTILLLKELNSKLKEENVKLQPLGIARPSACRVSFLLLLGYLVAEKSLKKNTNKSSLLLSTSS